METTPCWIVSSWVPSHAHSFPGIKFLPLLSSECLNRPTAQSNHLGIPQRIWPSSPRLHHSLPSAISSPLGTGSKSHISAVPPNPLPASVQEDALHSEISLLGALAYQGAGSCLQGDSALSWAARPEHPACPRLSPSGAPDSPFCGVSGHLGVTLGPKSSCTGQGRCHRCGSAHRRETCVKITPRAQCEGTSCDSFEEQKCLREMGQSAWIF